MSDPEFATDIRKDLMHMTLAADEAAAIIVLGLDGKRWTRLSSETTTEDVVSRLRELADEMEQE